MSKAPTRDQLFRQVGTLQKHIASTQAAGKRSQSDLEIHVQLTPVEIAISTMIRNGLPTKEIAPLRCISTATVRRHRENIRRKLGLRNRKANLATYLQASIANESANAGEAVPLPPLPTVGDVPLPRDWDAADFADGTHKSPR